VVVTKDAPVLITLMNDQALTMNVLPLIPDPTALHESLAYFPLATYEPGETVLAAGSKTGRLLFLKDGTVAVVRHGIRIAKEIEPGTVFGEMSALLDKPHTANVVALTTARFHVADAKTLLAQDSAALLHVATVLARRLDNTNQALIDLMHYR
jgi:CRP/FNR family transcriptional regulator, cyclic AMP receptor protein